MALGEGENSVTPSQPADDCDAVLNLHMSQSQVGGEVGSSQFEDADSDPPADQPTTS